MGGYWIDSPDNPFNQMSYTRGGGGYDNEQTHASNAARAFAMQGSGTGALPRYADTQTAQSVLPAGSLAVVGDYVVKTSGAGVATGQVGTAAPGKGGTGPGVAAAATGGGGTRSSGSRLVLATPQNRGAYKDDFVPGPLVWSFGEQFEKAPEIGGLKNEPLERVGIGGAQEAPGAISDIGWVRTNTGYMPVPSKDVKERLEDNALLELGWIWRNDIAPRFNFAEPVPPDFMDPRYSHYSPIANEWREGGAARYDKDGKIVFTGGGF